MRTNEKLILLFVLLAIGICLITGCAKADYTQLYKPPEEKQDVKKLCSDWVAVTDGIIE